MIKKLSVWIKQVFLFSCVLINRFHCMLIQYHSGISGNNVDNPTRLSLHLYYLYIGINRLCNSCMAIAAYEVVYVTYNAYNDIKINLPVYV